MKQTLILYNIMAAWQTRRIQEILLICFRFVICEKQSNGSENSHEKLL